MMTNEDIRIAVAECVGQRPCAVCINLGRPRTYMKRPNGIYDEHSFIPEYEVSLDAMHTVEEIIKTDKAHGWRYWIMLALITGADNDQIERWRQCQFIASATAMQRAEAFLRINGKWNR